MQMSPFAHTSYTEKHVLTSSLRNTGCAHEHHMHRCSMRPKAQVVCLRVGARIAAKILVGFLPLNYAASESNSRILAWSLLYSRKGSSHFSTFLKTFLWTPRSQWVSIMWYANIHLKHNLSQISLSNANKSSECVSWVSSNKNWMSAFWYVM